jgi:VTC domain
MIDAPGALADTYAQLATLIDAYEPLSLQELLALDGAALLDRIDVKFLLRPEQLLRALQPLLGCYRVLCINDVRLQHYHTLYFDTPDFTFYQQHHNDVRSRYKVRFRTYVDSRLSFLEVKVKTNKDRTVKNRIPVAQPTPSLEVPMLDFLRTLLPFPPERLDPKICNTFIRITLVSNVDTERLTLDLAVQFDETDASSVHPYLVIAEVKLARFSLQSPFLQQMRRVGGHELGLTKYCIGVAQRYKQLKCNNFKPVFLLMDKLANRGGYPG